ncbi:MAG TPA: homoserine kinase [Nitrososphaerales archaeon]|nr:homoserine kinase [Nitrososphaerales archaeon]
MRVLADSVSVVAPASSANLGPGFDVFGLALGRPHDRVTLERSPSGEFSLRLRVTPDVGISSESKRNACGAVAMAIASDFRLKGDLRLKLRKGVPVGVGMGGSGASSAAAAVAMNELFGLGLKAKELIRYAGIGERASSGTAHLDNVTASILGGFVVVPRNGSEPIRFQPPEAMRLCLATPRAHLPSRKTEYARSVLPRRVNLSQVVGNVFSSSRLVAGFATKDIGLIGESMQDEIVEPARAKMVPGYAAARQGAIESGASGVCISGAGPTVLAVVDRRRASPNRVLEAMLSSLRTARVSSTGFVTRPGRGAWVDGSG